MLVFFSSYFFSPEIVETIINIDIVPNTIFIFFLFKQIEAEKKGWLFWNESNQSRMKKK